MKAIFLFAAGVALQAASAPVITLVANAEGENPVIAPNTWVEIKGSNLAKATYTRQSSDIVNGQMPTALQGVSVTVNGKNAYVYYVSSIQIDILTPPDSLPSSAPVVVNNNGSLSAAFNVAAQALSPSFFNLNGGPYVIAQDAINFNLLGPASFSVAGYPFTPAKPNEIVTLWANGFGPTNTPIVSGSASQSGTLATLPAVTIAGMSAQVSYAGLAYPGEFQINVTIPAGAPSGDDPIVVTYGGVEAAPAGFITVQASAALPSTVTYYVAPNGNDLWSGTLAAPNAQSTDGPLATFDRARSLVQSINKAGLTQINVQFRGGRYYLRATEMFTVADSGSPALQIVYRNYPGEAPVLSGGMPVSNWTNSSGNTWKTTLPASTQFFENLFYNGIRRLRPRLGASAGSDLGVFYRIAGTVYLQSSASNCTVMVQGSGYECFDRFYYNPSDPISGSWKNLAPATGNLCLQTAGNQALAGDVEVLDFEQFSTSKLRISCIDTKNHIVYLTGPTTINANTPTQSGFIAGNRYMVDNVEDALTQPGQWFLDRSATPWTLTYLANPGENPNKDTVIVPQLPQLLVANGLQYVTFQGLSFEHDDYTIPAAGHKSSELEADIAGAVSFQNVQHVTLDSVTVTQIAGTGIEFISCIDQTSPGYCAAQNANAVTANNTIQNSAIYDVGVLGVRIGDPYTGSDNDSNEPQFSTVQNNVVEGYGRTIPASFGIGQGLGHDNLFTHNDVYDGYHCAISISEQAPDMVKATGNGNANNTISFNHVYNLLQGIMNDGGSIRIEAGNEVYTAPGNKIFNNKIHDVTDASIQDSNGYGGDGVYLDNQSGLIDVENNLVYRVSGNAIEMPQGPSLPNEANTIKNNILAYARGSMVQINFPYPYGVPAIVPQNAVIENNLMYFDRNFSSSPSFMVQGGCLYAGGVAYPQFQQWTSNMYWRTDSAFASDPKAFAVQPDPGSGGNAPCTGNTNKWTFYSFAQWQSQAGEDAHSLVQNPGFANPAYPNDNYSLPNGSPGIGFVVFDPTQAGRSNPVIMPPAVEAGFPVMNYNPATDY